MTENFLIRHLPGRDSHKISWVVDSIKYEIDDVPEVPQGLAEALRELRFNNEERTEFENKADLSYFWMSRAAKVFKVAHEEAV